MTTRASRVYSREEMEYMEEGVNFTIVELTANLDPMTYQPTFFIVTVGKDPLDIQVITPENSPEDFEILVFAHNSIESGE